MATILEIKDMTKRFGALTAVNAISLKVNEREIFGFLGPNGAGKTTTISMLTTLVRPTSGTAIVGGFDLLKEAGNVRAIIGVVPQTFSLFPELTPEENLEYIGKLYSMDRKTIKERTEQLLKKVTLWEHRTRIAGEFSGGMKQRLSLAASIMAKPKILFMDEPTTGLDPQSRLAIRELTKELNKEGMTIVYTTHDMEEVEKLCDRITIMDKGRIIADGTSRQIKDMVRHKLIIEVIVKSPTKQLMDELKGLRYVEKATLTENKIELIVDKKENVVLQLADVLRKRREVVQEIRQKEHTLEEVFILLTKKELRD